MQTMKNDFIVASDRTLRCGRNPAAVLTKANLCHRLFWVNCKYSNTLRSKHDDGDQTCQLSVMQNIARPGSQDMMAKQMFISEPIQIIVTFTMGGRGILCIKTDWGKVWGKKKKKSSGTCEHGDWAIFTSLEFTQSLGV